MDHYTTGLLPGAPESLDPKTRGVHRHRGGPFPLSRNASSSPPVTSNPRNRVGLSSGLPITGPWRSGVRGSWRGSRHGGTWSPGGGLATEHPLRHGAPPVPRNTPCTTSATPAPAGPKSLPSWSLGGVTGQESQNSDPHSSSGAFMKSRLGSQSSAPETGPSPCTSHTHPSSRL